MYILGLHNSYLSGAALYHDDNLIGAASEERFTRIKNYRGIPVNSIEYLLKKAKIELNDIDAFCYAMISDIYPDKEEFADILKDTKNTSLYWKNSPAKGFERIESEIEWNKKYLGEYDNWLNKNNIDRERSFQYDHHLIHASGALFSSPFQSDKEVLIFTADGKGGFKSSTFNYWDGKKLITKSYSSSFHSLGYFYGTITRLLGFKSERHEGKVTGLAAHGDPEKLAPLFREFINCKDGKINIKPSKYYLPWFVSTEELPAYKDIINDFSSEDIAAGAQKILEEVICEWIETNIKNSSNKPMPVCLSGGLFGNVKLNQKIKSLNNVESLFVMPAMGDGGLPLGACLLHKYNNKQNFWINTPLMSIGPEFTSEEFKSSIDDHFDVHEPEDLLNEITSLLNKDMIIGYFEGGMEFGPRALCNRSILANARDKDINNTLNKRLSRSDFMPFAPVTTDRLANLCFKNISKFDHTFPYMTCTVEVTDAFSKSCPAAVHIDGTARPQIVTENSNPFVYKLINTFYDLFGDLCIINTSFNLHEEPIVCTPNDALRALKLNAVDVLTAYSQIITNKVS